MKSGNPPPMTKATELHVKGRQMNHGQMNGAQIRDIDAFCFLGICLISQLKIRIACRLFCQTTAASDGASDHRTLKTSRQNSATNSHKAQGATKRERAQRETNVGCPPLMSLPHKRGTTSQNPRIQCTHLNVGELLLMSLANKRQTTSQNPRPHCVLSG